MLSQHPQSRTSPSSKNGSPFATDNAYFSSDHANGKMRSPSRNGVPFGGSGANDDDSKDRHHKRRHASGRGLVGTLFAWALTLRLFVRQLRYNTSRLHRSKARSYLVLASFVVFCVFALGAKSKSGRTKNAVEDVAPRPRILGYYFESERMYSVVLKRYDNASVEPPPRRFVKNERGEKPKRSRPMEEWEKPPCVAMHEWQKKSFPSCNKIHEFDLMKDLGASDAKIVNHGYFRDVWMVKDMDGKTKRAFKTLRIKQALDAMNYDRHRRDAVAMERLTSSQNILDIFGFCGNSGISEYGDHGDLEDATYGKKAQERLSPVEKLTMANQVALGIADTHSVEEDGRSALAHTDISPGQFILIDGFYKLNDFNRVRFIRKDQDTGGRCTYTVGNNPGDFRSPEEYRYDGQTEKVDVYSMGNVFYVILTGHWPFEINGSGSESVDANKAVKRGERPVIPDELGQSTDPATVALIHAMKMCWIHDQEERASAREVLNYIDKELSKIELGNGQ